MEWARSSQCLGEYFSNAGCGMSAPLIQQQQQMYHQSVHLSAQTPVTRAVTTETQAATVHSHVDGPYQMQANYTPVNHYSFDLPQPQLPANGVLKKQEQVFFNMHPNDYQMSGIGSSNRMARNMAEKHRRDKLNAYINELAALVPMVYNSSKKLDKTSILRLSASFLRMHQLVKLMKNQHLKIPQFLHSVDWSQLLLEEIEGVMLITTSAGKIVFISNTIEKLLKHTQGELFGQSLFNITCPEDHTELTKCLTPNKTENISSEIEFDCDDSVSASFECTHCTSRCINSTSKTMTKVSPEAPMGNSAPSTEVDKQRRSFYLRLRHRGLARSEEPQFELVNVIGYLLVPKRLICLDHKKSSKHKVDVMTTNSDEILLVAIMKPFREKRVTEVSLTEATLDEYITRHSLDGRIIYSDHRISVVSGYLFNEVCGLPAFNFMHREDVCWVLIALRQMFWKSESYGSSCYRLKSKTGEFIYLKTHGYLELTANSETYASFICVNTLVSRVEGEREIQRMRKRFSVIIENNIEPGIAEIAKHNLSIDDSDGEQISGTEDPAVLKCAIRQMIANIPAPTIVYEDPQMSRETQFVKAKLMSKQLPPMTQATTNMITIVRDNLPEQSRTPSPQSITNTVFSTSAPSTPTSLNPISPSICSVRLAQNRPSVLRQGPGFASRQLSTYNSLKNSLDDADCPSNKYNARKCEDFAKERGKSVVKQEQDYDPLPWIVNIPNGREDDRRRRLTLGIKRNYDMEETSFSAVPNKMLMSNTMEDTLCSEPPAYRNKYLPTWNPKSVQKQLFLNDGKMHSSPLGVFNQHLITFGDMGTSNSFYAKVEPDFSSVNMDIESQLHLQSAQIDDIEDNLDNVPFTDQRFRLHAGVSKLKN